MLAEEIPTLPAALADLAPLRRWVAWRWETRNGKTTKVPKTRGNRGASTRLESDWLTYEQAALIGGSGVGFVLSGVNSRDLVAIDLDKVRTKETGELLPWAAELVETCASYTEVTPSESGLRIIGTGLEVPDGIERRVQHPQGGSFELYACPTARYVTVTGWQLRGTADHRADISKPFLELLSLAPNVQSVPTYIAPVFSRGEDIDPDTVSYAVMEHVTHVHEGADRSGNFYAVVCELKDAGHPPQAITRFLERYPNGCAAKYRGRLEQEVRRAWMKAPDPTPIQVVFAPSTAVPAHDPETGEVLDETPAPTAAAESVIPVSDELPDELTRVPGLLGEVVDWIEASARRPNRTLALGAAITTVGTLMGRRTAGPTLSGTHLYIVALAPSGAGKDHPLRMVMELIKAANAGHLLGPDEFISMPAVIQFLKRSPLSVCPMDEIGAFLKRLSHHRASPYEKSVTKMLRTAWGASFKTITTPEWGSKQMEEIWFPALSIFGVSTPAEFFEALEGGDVVNGFLNRFLLLTSSKRTRDVTPKADPLNVPPALAKALTDLFITTNRITASDLKKPIGTHADPRSVTWSRDGKAEPLFELLKADVERICADDEIEPFFARTVEMALRLATIRAVGRNLSKRAVDQGDMEWGRDLALWSARRMAKAARGYIAENQTQSFSNRVLRAVERKGGRISHRDLQRSLKGAIKPRELADILKNLLEAEMLREERTVPAGGGTPSRWYVAAAMETH